LFLERLGREKTSDVNGVAMTVSNNEPINNSGRFDSPNEIAPSSRKGKTTKYALKICNTKLKKLVKRKKKNVKVTWMTLRWETDEEEAEEWMEKSRGFVRVHRNEHGHERIQSRPPHRAFLFSDRRKEEERTTSFKLQSQSIFITHVIGFTTLH